MQCRNRQHRSGNPKVSESLREADFHVMRAYRNLDNKSAKFLASHYSGIPKRPRSTGIPVTTQKAAAKEPLR
jgi:hypothetical protein